MLSVGLSHTHTRWQAIKMAVTSRTHDSFPGGTKKCLSTLFFFFFFKGIFGKEEVDCIFNNLFYKVAPANA